MQTLPLLSSPYMKELPNTAQIHSVHGNQHG